MKDQGASSASYTRVRVSTSIFDSDAFSVTLAPARCVTLSGFITGAARPPKQFDLCIEVLLLPAAIMSWRIGIIGGELLNYVKFGEMLSECGRCTSSYPIACWRSDFLGDSIKMFRAEMLMCPQGPFSLICQIHSVLVSNRTPESHRNQRNMHEIDT
jgi:hypothetical protein